MEFGTKAETLARLSGRICTAKLLPQACFRAKEWVATPKRVLDEILSLDWASWPLILRSSAWEEDRDGESQAGKYLSVSGIQGRKALENAADQVVESMVPCHDYDQFFIQPMVCNIRFSGVAFNRDPNSGAPYILINYDENQDSTCGVTSGQGTHLKVYCHYKELDATAPENLFQVIELVRELETYFPESALDIEFAVTMDGTLYLLQVRPLDCPQFEKDEIETHRELVARVAQKINRGMQPHPYLFGKQTAYGVMPDWNPAEIIGIRPRPLSFSLYRELVTDNIWAYQRHNYGYRNLRSFPLLVSFGGLPYVDVRVSFNSFIPAGIGDDLAERLADYYVRRLVDAPASHDKVEFDIVFSCYTPDLEQRLDVLRTVGFSREDCRQILTHLRCLTNGIIHPKKGLWQTDLEKIDILAERQKRLSENIELDPVEKIYWLLEDCKRYGTLPFAGLARAAFISIQFLKSLVSIGILSSEEHECFLNSLNTVGSRLTRDFKTMNREAFLQIYGHLRPGTYDILSPRYDEMPDRYFNWESQKGKWKKGKREKEYRFTLSRARQEALSALLRQHKLNLDAGGLLNFFRQAIEGREYAKFVFTRSISDILCSIRELGRRYGLSLKDCAYLDIGSVFSLYASTLDPAEVFRDSAAAGKRHYRLSRQILLPPLITGGSDAVNFLLPPSSPNFITLKRTRGWVADIGCHDRLSGAILVLPSADPGYDWIFSRGIKGFITMYGGANSHMAIRALELGMPAVIGCGEILYNKWQSANALEIDCPNRTVKVLDVC